MKHKMHFTYMVVICFHIPNVGLGQNIDQTVFGNTSTSNQEMSGSETRIDSPTVNPPPLQTTGISISGIQRQSSNANIINATSSTDSAPHVSRHQTPTLSAVNAVSPPDSNEDLNPATLLLPVIVSVRPTQLNDPIEHKNAVSDPAREGSETTLKRTTQPQELGRVPPAYTRTIRTFTPPVKPHTTPTRNTILIPPKSQTTPVSKPTTLAGLTKPLITKPEVRSVVTKKVIPSQGSIAPAVSTTTSSCSSYGGTFLQLLFESTGSSQDLCRQQIKEIQEGIEKYASDRLQFATHSVLVLNSCEMCQSQNKTQTVNFNFCIQTEKRCDVDATGNVWNLMNDQTERHNLQVYLPVSVKILRVDLKKQEPIDNMIPLSVGLLGVAFLIIISAIFIFQRKKKKVPTEGRFYFDGSKIQDCLDSGGQVNESHCLDKIKDREQKHMSLLIPAINLGLDIDEEHKPENEFPSHLLSVNALKMYYTYKEAIDEEFKSLPYFRPLLKELPVGVGSKNRTAHVLPPLDTRVVLSSRIDSTGYINANKIKGYQSSKVDYIATQAPLSGTCADFWHMVWEQQSRVIIMLCTPEEIGKHVPQYWPQKPGMESALLFGDILVCQETMTSSGHHTVSNLVLKDIERNLCRPISHYWFSWPTNEVPSSPSDVTGLLLHIRESITENQGPLVVHCSDGVGQTGTLITIDICMHELEDTTHVDVPRTTCMVRKDRGAGVENALQYNYIYQALYDYSQRLSRANQQVGW